MGQLLIRNVPDATIDVFKKRAEINGHSLEQELRDLLERNRPFTTEERVALTKRFLSEYPDVQPSLTREERHEGLK